MAPPTHTERMVRAAREGREGHGAMERGRERGLGGCLNIATDWRNHFEPVPPNDRDTNCNPLVRK